ncbi:MAINTENANCE OF PSII UNDER HIGH LIGHT 1-like protein [Drosera capensis]
MTSMAHMLSAANTRAFPFCSQRLSTKILKFPASFRLHASSSLDESDCNDAECAPEKEVGAISMDWVAREKTNVVGTFPPRTRGWTGYVEKDTAGQTNIYSVEPAVYVAESAISSGNSGTSSEGSENTAAIAAGIAIISLAAASSVALQLGKAPLPIQTTTEYSGHSLSYYINKFTAAGLTDTGKPSQSTTTEVAAGIVDSEKSSESTATEVSQSEDQSAVVEEPSTQ